MHSLAVTCRGIPGRNRIHGTQRHDVKCVKPRTSPVPARGVLGFCCCLPIVKSAGSTSCACPPPPSSSRSAGRKALFPAAATGENPGAGSGRNSCSHTPTPIGSRLAGRTPIFSRHWGKPRLQQQGKQLLAPSPNQQATWRGEKHFSSTTATGELPCSGGGNCCLPPSRKGAPPGRNRVLPWLSEGVRCGGH